MPAIEREQEQSAAYADSTKPERYGASPDRRNKEKRHAKRACDRAGGGHPIDGARHGPGPLAGAQHKPDGKRRIDTEQHHRHEHDRKHGVKAAEAHIVYSVENKAQYRLAKTWPRPHV